MALPASIEPEALSARAASREILLWTTRDGREIPLDEMSDDHVTNAVRVLSLWRSRLKKRGGDEAIIADLKTAIERFKTLQRRRRKSTTTESGSDHEEAPPSRLSLAKPVRAAKPQRAGFQSSSKPASGPSRWARPRKPVAKT